jgi:Asp-tRNA(Asn)/Glu-tRNA(Gln) amidotransferase A subunit family amidase
MTEQYDLTSLDLPRLQGRSLDLFAASLDNSLMRAALLGKLLKDGGINRLRETAVAAPPTYYPLSPEEAAAARDRTGVDPAALADEALAAPNPTRFNSIADYARAYREGQATPVAVAERVLAAIAKSDDGPRPLRAFRAADRADVLRQAEASAARLRDGRPLSLLDGVPIGIKDEVDMVPYTTTVGTSFMGDRPATTDSTVVARLRAAGALLLGKTVMHEIGINPDGFNEHYGTTRTPYDLDRHAGGSSGGSAAAVAAGLCPAAIGADGGGSIRIPAALNGIVGLKATFSRVSEFGAAPLTWTMGHLGPLAATTADAALVYAAIAGPDPLDPLTANQPPVTLDGWNTPDLAGLVVGIYPPWLEHAAFPVVDGCRSALDVITEAGATLREIRLPGLDEMRIAQVATILAEMATAMSPYYDDHWHDLSAGTRINLTIGRSLTAADYLQAQRIRTEAIATFRAAFAGVDLILSPATAVTAPPVLHEAGWTDLSTVTELMRFAMPGNLTGLPAIVFPVGYDDRGLPIGMQAMSRAWDEHLLLRLAFVMEAAMIRQRPPLYFDLLAG